MSEKEHQDRFRSAGIGPKAGYLLTFCFAHFSVLVLWRYICEMDRRSIATSPWVKGVCYKGVEYDAIVSAAEQQVTSAISSTDKTQFGQTGLRKGLKHRA